MVGVQSQDFYVNKQYLFKIFFPKYDVVDQYERTFYAKKLFKSHINIEIIWKLK